MKQTLASMMMLLTLWTGLFGATGSFVLCIHDQGSIHVLVSHETTPAATASCGGEGCTEQHEQETSDDASLNLEQDRNCADILVEVSDEDTQRPANSFPSHAPTLCETSASHTLGSVLDTKAPASSVKPNRGPPLIESTPVRLSRTTVLRL